MLALVVVPLGARYVSSSFFFRLLAILIGLLLMVLCFVLANDATHWAVVHAPVLGLLEISCNFMDLKVTDSRNQSHTIGL